MSGLAPLIGTKVRYVDVPLNDIMIVRSDGECLIISVDTFDHLYFRLSDDEAALKEDCIEYVVYNIYKPLEEYPEWFNKAVYVGWIYREGSTHLFLGEHGYEPMSPESVILRNFKGDMRYLERIVFNSIYDPI